MILMMMNCHQSRTIQPSDDANNVEEGQGFEQELGDHDGDQDCDGSWHGQGQGSSTSQLGDHDGHDVKDVDDEDKDQAPASQETMMAMM